MGGNLAAGMNLASPGAGAAASTLGGMGPVAAAPQVAGGGGMSNLFTNLGNTARHGAQSIGQDFKSGNIIGGLSKVHNFQQAMKLDLLDSLSGNQISQGLQDRLASGPQGIPSTVRASTYMLDNAVPNQFLGLFDAMAKSRQRRQQQQPQQQPYGYSGYGTRGF